MRGYFMQWQNPKLCFAYLHIAFSFLIVLLAGEICKTNRLQESQTMNHFDYQIKDATDIIESLMVIRKVNCEIISDS